MSFLSIPLSANFSSKNLFNSLANSSSPLISPKTSLSGCFPLERENAVRA